MTITSSTVPRGAVMRTSFQPRRLLISVPSLVTRTWDCAKAVARGSSVKTSAGASARLSDDGRGLTWAYGMAVSRCRGERREACHRRLADPVPQNHAAAAAVDLSLAAVVTIPLLAGCPGRTLRIERDAEGGGAAVGPLEGIAEAMAGEDLPDQRQADALAVRLGAEERREQV